MPEGREWRLLICGLFIADLGVYCAGLLSSAVLLARAPLSAPDSGHYAILIMLALPVVATIFFTRGLYDPQYLLGGTREYSAVLRSCLYSLVALMVLSFALRIPISREWILLSTPLAAAGMGAMRFGARRLQRRLRHRGLFTSRAVLVGADAQAVATARQLSAADTGIELVGVLDDYLPVGTLVAGRLKVLGSSARMLEVTFREAARDVIVIPEALPWESLQAVLTQSTVAGDGLRVHLVGGVYDLLAAGVRLSERNGIPLLTVKKAALSRAQAGLKRSLDCIVSVGLLLALAPVSSFELLWLWSRQSPLLERRLVLDRSGRSFELLSFPSDVATHSVLVRKIPSLLNVIRGQLSIVGPCPVPANDVRKTDDIYPFALRPGVTGLWRQVQDPGEQALLDLYYLRVYSIWLDLQILLGRLRTRLRVHRDRSHTGEPWPVSLN